MIELGLELLDPDATAGHFALKAGRPCLRRNDAMLGEQLLFLGNLLDSEPALLGEALYLLLKAVTFSVDRRRRFGSECCFGLLELCGYKRS